MALFDRKPLLFLLLCLFYLMTEIPDVNSASNFKLVCYYTNWAIYRPSLAKFTPQNINPYQCTHLIYAFAGLTRRFEVKPFDAYNDIQQGNYNKFIDLKKYNPELKTMIAIGGWNEGSKKFSEMVSEDKNRKKFVKSAMKFLREHRFDGLDLDWEYPTFRDGSRPEDKEGYAELVQELRDAFDKEKLSSGKDKLLLSMAVPAGRQYIDQGYDIPSLSKNLDFFNLLTYDFYTTQEGLANHHAALYAVEEHEDWDHHGQLNVDWTVNYYLELGVPPAKINVGVPTYGRAFALTDPDEHELGSPIKGAAEAGPATREAGYLAYFEICQNVLDKDWEEKKTYPDAVGPYAFKDDQWVGYDDEAMVIRKSKYVVENKLGGIMFWSLDTDDFRGHCGGGNSPLITAARKTLFSKTKSKRKPSSDDVVDEEEEAIEEEEPLPKRRMVTTTTTSRPKRTTTTTEATTTPEEEIIEAEQVEENEEIEVTARPNSRSDRSFGTRGGGGRGQSRSSRGRQQDDTEEEEPEAWTTPEPPTTPDPGPAFECKDEGFFLNPKDCRKYFWCLDSGPADLGIVAHHFTCPSGLFFNTNSDSCDYKENVKCKLNPALGTTTITPKVRATTRAPKRTTTTTTEEAETEVAEVEAKPEEENVAQLLQLIKKLGGVEQVQKHLGIDEQKDAPEAQVQRSRVPSSSRSAKSEAAAEEEEQPPEKSLVASIAEEAPRRRTTRRRTTTTTATPEVATRARRPSPRASRRTTTEPPVEEEAETTPPRTASRRRLSSSARAANRVTTSTADPDEDVLVDNSRQSTTVQKFQNVDSGRKVLRKIKVQVATTTEEVAVEPEPKKEMEPEYEDGETHTFRQTRIPRLFRYHNINRTNSNDATASTIDEAEEEVATTKKPAAARELKSILDALAEPTTDHLSADQSTVVTIRDAHAEVEEALDDSAARESKNVQVASIVEPEHFQASSSPPPPFENIGVHLEERTGAPEVVHVGETIDYVGDETTVLDDYYIDEIVVEPTTTATPTTTTTTAPTSVTVRRFRPPTTIRTTTTTETETEAPTTTKRALPPRAFRTTSTTTTTPKPPPVVVRVKQADGAVIDEEFQGLTIGPDGELECLEQGVYPHPTDCDKYVSCVHQQEVFTPYVYGCPAGQLYDEFTGRCLDENTVECKATK